METPSNGLDRVREVARKEKDVRFTALLHHVTPVLLWQAFDALNPHAARGVDGETVEHYREQLWDNLQRLHTRLQNGQYRPYPSKRIRIPKADGTQRLIGIAALEDKIIQKALVWVLEAIYEEDFLGFSYGYRPQRGAHKALDALYVAITEKRVNHVLDADIKQFFDTLDHGWLMRFLQHRIADPRVLLLIERMLKAGVLEGEQWSASDIGTPQGAVISPLLANLYLHYALDQWVQQQRRRAHGEIYIVRYADDFVMGFEYANEAQRFRSALETRLGRFGLALHSDKTRLIEFGRWATKSRQKQGLGKPETFDFLGFTHICSVNRKGGFMLARHTIAKRLRAKIKQVKEKLMKNRAYPVAQQGKWLKQVIQGFCNYHGVPTNVAALQTFRTETCKNWLAALRRRSQKAASLNWQKFTRLVRQYIPSVRLTHPFPNERFYG